MRKSRFTESQIVSILKDGDAGIPLAELVRKHGISRATYFNWKSKYAGAGWKMVHAFIRPTLATSPRNAGAASATPHAAIPMVSLARCIVESTPLKASSVPSTCCLIRSRFTSGIATDYPLKSTTSRPVPPPGYGPVPCEALRFVDATLHQIL
jgi:hypothetical protein